MSRWDGSSLRAELEEHEELTIVGPLMAALQLYAPTISEQVQVTQLVNVAVRNGASKEDIIKMLAGMLLDGLRHGNWPWRPRPEVVLAMAAKAAKEES